MPLHVKRIGAGTAAKVHISDGNGNDIITDLREVLKIAARNDEGHTFTATPSPKMAREAIALLLG